MESKERAIIIQYMYEDLFDGITKNEDLLTEAKTAALKEFVGIDIAEADKIGEEVVRLYDTV